jgi:hypothetical protein
VDISGDGTCEMRVCKPYPAKAMKTAVTTQITIVSMYSERTGCNGSMGWLDTRQSGGSDGTSDCGMITETTLHRISQ